MVLVVVVVVGLIVATAFKDGMARPGPQPAPVPTETPAIVYHIEDRSGYQDMVDRIVGLSDKYNGMAKDGTIWDVAPRGRATDPEYVGFFTARLPDERLALMFRGPGNDSIDPVELDEQIRGRRADVDQWEKAFLAGDPLSSPYVVRDGKPVVFEPGPPVPNPPAPRPPSADEQKAAGFETEKKMAATTWAKGYDGTYREAGVRLAQMHPMSVDYNWNNLHQACPSGRRDDTWVAAYCSATKFVLYIHTTHEDYPEYYSNPRYADTIRHEVAHRRIHDICGTTSPPIAGASYEAVTNSYAAAFLGASRERLQTRDTADPYHMTDRSDQIAKSIHEGRCQ